MFSIGITPKLKANQTIITKEKLQDQYAHIMSVRKHKCNETAITWVHRAKEFSLLDRDEMTEQMKMWRKQAKAGELKIMKYNNKAFTINGMKKTELNGKVWHCLVVQGYKGEVQEEGNLSPFGCLILGYLVTGMMYAFDKAENRDAVYSYIMKGIAEAAPREKNM